MGDSSTQRVGEWGGVMSVGRNFVAGQVFNQSELHVFITMIMSCAFPDRGVDATVDNSCDDANMQYAIVDWWLAVETVKKNYA